MGRVGCIDFTNPGPVALTEHLTWWTRAVQSPKRWLAIAQVGPRPVGVIRLDLEGATATVTAVLSKAASTYPVTIPYIVSGTATNPSDHDAANGNIVINSGITGSITFLVKNDAVADAGETVVFTMGAPTNATAGTQASQTVTITEGNGSPSVSLRADQASVETHLIVTGNGPVTVTANVTDPNAGDTHSYDWSLSNASLLDINDGDPATFVFDPSALAPFLLGAFVGVLAAIMGVGGGFILIPAMTYLLDMPMQVVVGTSLFQMLFTSSSVTLMQAAMNHTVDVVLAAILLIGSTLGAQLGARAAQKLRADQLKVVFSLLVLAMSVKMLNGLLAAPAFLLQELVGRR